MMSQDSSEELEAHIVNNYVRIDDIAIPIQWSYVFSPEVLRGTILKILDEEDDRNDGKFYLTVGGIRARHFRAYGKHLFIRTSLIADMELNEVPHSEENENDADDEISTGTSPPCSSCEGGAEE